MSFRATALWRLLLAAGFLGWTAASVSAQDQQQQQAKYPIVFPRQGTDAIDVTMMKAPVMASEGSKSSSQSKQWLRVEIHYTAQPETGDFLNEVQFKVWVEGRDLSDPQGRPGEGVAVCLTGSVTYVNVPKNRDVYAVVYIPPDTVTRYSGSRGVSEFTRTYNLHVDGYVDGKPVVGIDRLVEKGDPGSGTAPDPEWYNKCKPIPGLIYLQNQSPFINVDVDRYPPLKLPESNSK